MSGRTGNSSSASSPLDSLFNLTISKVRAVSPRSQWQRRPIRHGLGGQKTNGRTLPTSVSLAKSSTALVRASTALWLVNIIPPYRSPSVPSLSRLWMVRRLSSLARCSRTGTNIGENSESGMLLKSFPISDVLVDVRDSKCSSYASGGVDRVLRSSTGMRVIFDGGRGRPVGAGLRKYDTVTGSLDCPVRE